MGHHKPELEPTAEMLDFGDNQPDQRCNAYCATCDSGLHITGTGKYAKRVDPELGGVYFCSENCAIAWDQSKLPAAAAANLAQH